jgi:hypothetical protein
MKGREKAEEESVNRSMKSRISIYRYGFNMNRINWRIICQEQLMVMMIKLG